MCHELARSAKMTQTEMPSAIDAEYGLLGLILWHNRTFPVNPADFYRQDHRMIYKSIQTVADRGDAVDPISVSYDLEKIGLTEILETPTLSYLYELQNREMELFDPGLPEQRAATYARLIAETAKKRHLIAAAGKIINDIALNGSKDPIKEAMELLEKLAGDTKQDNDQRLVIGAKGKIVLRSDSLEDVLNYPDPEYLVAKILEIATVSLLYGESGTGKTFIALAVALAVAFGKDWLGRRVKQGPVLYFYQEGKLGLKKRVKVWLTYYGVESLPTNIRFITVPTHLTHDREYILNAIEEQDTPPVLVIVDTFSNCAPGVSQNNQEEVYPVLAVGHEIAKAYNSHFMFIHHDNKNGDYNGSKAFRNHVDTMILVEKGNTDGSIILHSKKSREEEPFGDIALQLLRVELDDELSSCVVVTSDAKTTGTIPQPQFQILEILHESGSLASNEWFRKCEKAYKMIYMTWNRHRKKLEQAGLIDSSDGNGKTYTVTQKGIDILQDMPTTNTTNSYSHVSDVTTNTTNTTLSSVSSVSRGDTNEPIRIDAREKVRYSI
jgi:predicted transcriptional regulator